MFKNVLYPLILRKTCTILELILAAMNKCQLIMDCAPSWPTGDRSIFRIERCLFLKVSIPNDRFLTRNAISRVDTDVELEVAYSCNIFAVPDSLTCPDIQTS